MTLGTLAAGVVIVGITALLNLTDREAEKANEEFENSHEDGL